MQKVADDKKKNVYAIFDDGAMIYDRSNNKLETFGNVLAFEPKE